MWKFDKIVQQNLNVSELIKQLLHKSEVCRSQDVYKMLLPLISTGT